MKRKKAKAQAKMQPAKAAWLALVLMGTGLVITGWKTWVGMVGAQTAGNPAYSFTVAGDFDGNASTTDPVLQGIGGPASAFTLATGDFRYGAKTDEEGWCSYVKSFVGETYPFQLVTGNHENPGEQGSLGSGPLSANSIDNIVDGSGNVTNYGYSACLPDRMGSVGTYGREYYFDYNNNTRVIMVSPDSPKFANDGTTILDPYAYAGPGDVHYDWLAARIDEAKLGGKWVVVGMHKNCISVGEKSCEIGEAVMDLLISKKVDLVFQGHDHTYQRSHSLIDANSNAFNTAHVADFGNDNYYDRGVGTVFVVVGTGGRLNLYSVEPADGDDGYFVTKMGGDSANPPGQTYGYIKVDVTDQALAVNFVPRAGGTYTDSFTIGTPPTPTIGPSAIPTSMPSSVTRQVVADARVQQDYPGTNYGNSSYVRVNNGSSNASRTFMKYDLTGLSGTVAGARLRLWVNSNSGSGTNVNHVVKGLTSVSWIESGTGSVTWNLQPSLGAQIGVLPIPVGGSGAAAGTMVEASLDTAYIQSNLGQIVGLGLDHCITGSLGCATVDSANYDSKEGTNKPQLVIDFVSGDATPVVPTATSIPPTPTDVVPPTITNTPAPTDAPTPTPIVTVFSFGSIGDATIKQSSATKNFGSTTIATSDGSPNEDFLIKFNVTGLAGRTVQSAKLRLYASNGSSGTSGSGGAFYKTGTAAWIETGSGSVTWNNAPAIVGSALQTLGPVSANTFVEVNVSAAVQGDGVVGFRVDSASSDGVDYRTKEWSTVSQRPELVVTLHQLPPPPQP